MEFSSNTGTFFWTPRIGSAETPHLELRATAAA
jgi:hypothetical protein